MYTLIYEIGTKSISLKNKVAILMMLKFLQIDKG